MDSTRRTIVATGAAATAMAPIPRMFAQYSGQEEADRFFFQKGAVHIHREETGSGFPLLLIADGGFNSTTGGLISSSRVGVEEYPIII
jgi:hypothetical protein